MSVGLHLNRYYVVVLGFCEFFFFPARKKERGKMPANFVSMRNTSISVYISS